MNREPWWPLKWNSADVFADSQNAVCWTMQHPRVAYIHRHDTGRIVFMTRAPDDPAGFRMPGGYQSIGPTLLEYDELAIRCVLLELAYPGGTSDGQA